MKKSESAKIGEDIFSVPEAGSGVKAKTSITILIGHEEAERLVTSRGGSFFNEPGQAGRFEVVAGDPKKVAPRDDGAQMFWHESYLDALFFQGWLAAQGWEFCVLWDTRGDEPGYVTLGRPGN